MPAGYLCLRQAQRYSQAEPAYPNHKTFEMAKRAGGKMKNLTLIALIAALGLSGCASSGTGNLMIQDWTTFWEDPVTGSLGGIRQDWTEFWENPVSESMVSIKQDWSKFWKNPVAGSLVSIKQDWSEFWN